MKIPHIVSITKNGSNPAYQGARLGMDRYAAQRPVRLEHRTPVQDDSIEEQSVLLQQLLEDPVDALLISASHPSALDAELEALRQRGVLVIMFVGRTHRQDLAECFIGSNDRAMTRGVARTVCEALGGQGTVACLDGNPLGILYEARAGGFRDGVAEFPGVRIIGARDGDFLRGPSREAMEALIQEHGVPDAVLAANDFSAMGAIDALRALGASTIVGGVNATPDGVRAIKSGHMLASAAFNAMAMGCLALEAALRSLGGQSIPGQIILPAEVVTRREADVWDQPYETRPLPDWDSIVAAQSPATV